ncbi:ferrous iron transport protein B [Streptococcus iniae]|uniref:Ferrous iron transport protein B n=2 Tax=Streptococcus iniae TaxID=1346 RepID=A0A3L8GE85_STRIN|nr:ferrous iron transport protein B [Streptococcus iniae]AGM99884.1 ferrous iron transport protein B [Streptococcus iniae SF1]AHY16727.1 ferrous iron transporter B [Streptococcus iniae]AHY18592.1 ferrous iron transporter B [Streptococcus iniae]APD32752.1 ferrous iron transport protein B [Streptococcus iniae]ASL35778.1 putative ferrous ion transport protein B [Streptococcus iniae]
MKKIALIGNPNSGKTSLFNLLTGSNQRVGNWPGVTVARKSGFLKKDKEIEIQDLPGVYSMSPYTPEEKIARDYLLSGDSQLIINLVDATNLERSLYLTLQLIEIGLPMILALNMSDILASSGKQINCDKLSYQLGIPVIAISALKKTGLDHLLTTSKHLLSNSKKSPQFPVYDQRLEVALSQIEALIEDKTLLGASRFNGIKLFEQDPLVLESVSLSTESKAEIRDIISITESIFFEDAETIIINQRYQLIERICQLAQVTENHFELQLSDKIDRIVTNRFLALPIFALTMFGVYFLSIQTIGTLGTDWVNDVVFGHYIPQTVEGILSYLKVEQWLQSLLLDGIIAGVGAVVGFVPQIFVLFICLGILEDIGYMSRIAFIMDRFFRRFGLSGKSFIPMLIATGCGVPAIMASRTIENERDRRITIMTTTFMPCSAKLSIIALIAGAFFPSNPMIAPSAYFIGIATIVFSGIALKKTRMLGGVTSPFIMELPAYHLPNLLTVLRYALGKAWSFVKRAGTIIFVCTILIWFMSSYNLRFEAVETDKSILASLGHLLSWLFIPLGFGNWRATVATATGLLAKETVVATFGILYHQNDATETSKALWSSLQADYSWLSAYSFLVFNLLCAPCFAAIGAIKREMNHLRWSLVAIVFQTGLAYVISLIIYQLGLLLLGKPVTVFSVVAMLSLLSLIYFVLRPSKSEMPTVINLEELKKMSSEK